MRVNGERRPTVLPRTAFPEFDAGQSHLGKSGVSGIAPGKKLRGDSDLSSWLPIAQGLFQVPRDLVGQVSGVQGDGPEFAG